MERTLRQTMKGTLYLVYISHVENLFERETNQKQVSDARETCVEKVEKHKNRETNEK